jgi:hypothetical protein
LGKEKAKLKRFYEALLRVKDKSLSEKENQILDVERVAARAEREFGVRIGEMQDGINAAREKRDGFSFKKVLQEEVRRKEEEFVGTLKEQHSKRMHQIDTLATLDGDKRELVFKLISVFEESKQPGLTAEFTKFLNIIASNVKSKGGNFLSNGFVNYL